MATRRARICWRRDWRCSTATVLRARRLPRFARGRAPRTAASSTSSDRRRNWPARCFWKCCSAITPPILAALDPWPAARGEGIDRLIRAHLDWVVNNRREARYLFEISRSEWTEESARRTARAECASRRRHRALARAAGRAWRIAADDAGRCSSARSSDPRRSSVAPICRVAIAAIRGCRPINLVACAIRALVASDAGDKTERHRHDRRYRSGFRADRTSHSRECRPPGIYEPCRCRAFRTCARIMHASRSIAGRNCCSSTACSMAASPRSWSTTRPRLRRRPRAASRR